MIEVNYAEYRSQMKKVNPDLDEPSIYASFFKVVYGDWHIQQTPIRGTDGKYHFIYISLCDNGKFYLGKHSTDDLSDPYIGSGVKVQELVDSGHRFVKIALEYFRNSKSAYEAEHLLVNQRMLNESSDMVLNQVEGGESVFRTQNSTGVSKGDSNAIPPHEPKKSWLFSDLKLKVGEALTLIGREDVKCMVFDSRFGVMYKGTMTNLKKLASKFGVFHKNTLDSWMYDGKSLAWRRDEIIKGNI